jgi:hypothetical protein
MDFDALKNKGEGGRTYGSFSREIVAVEGKLKHILVFTLTTACGFGTEGAQETSISK